MQKRNAVRKTRETKCEVPQLPKTRMLKTETSNKKITLKLCRNDEQKQKTEIKAAGDSKKSNAKPSMQYLEMPEYLLRQVLVLPVSTQVPRLPRKALTESLCEGEPQSTRQQKEIEQLVRRKQPVQSQTIDKRKRNTNNQIEQINKSYETQVCCGS